MHFGTPDARTEQMAGTIASKWKPESGVPANDDIELTREWLRHMGYSDAEASALCAADELHGDLVHYAEKHENGCFTIDHPLVREVSIPRTAGWINGEYLRARRWTDRLRSERKWGELLSVVVAPYRFDELTALRFDGAMSPSEYWEQFGELWVETDYIWQDRDEWESVLFDADEDAVDDVRRFTNEHERRIFDALPERVTLYRVYSRADQEQGLSYTLNRSMAEWFALHHRRLDVAPDIEPTVKVLTLKKSRLFAYKDREEEVILRPYGAWSHKGRKLRARPRVKDLQASEVGRVIPRAPAS